MSWRNLITASLIAFPVVVFSSFGYGVFLLIRGPSTQAGPREGPRPALEPQQRAALLDRAHTQLAKREVEQALLSYRRILVAKPDDEEALQGLADGERQAGREEVAAREYERVVRVDPRNPVALLQLASLDSHRKESWGRAEQRYRAYLELKPGDAEARLGLARLLVWRGQTSGAVESFSEGGVKPLLTPQDQKDYALALAKSGRGSDAEPVLKALVAASPQDPDLALALGGLSASRGDWAAAIPLFRVALKGRPQDPQANLAYGQGLLSLKDYASAVGPLEKATRALPGSRAAGLAFARALRGAGESRRAEHEYERVWPQFADDAEVAREYGDLLMERKSYRRAETVFRDSMAHGLRDERLLAGLARALDGNGKPKEALPLLEEAYQRQPTDRLAYDLARLYQKLGQQDRALKLLAQLERSTPR
jgi:tetratricopeptide (TPR) repeat protein